MVKIKDNLFYTTTKNIPGGVYQHVYITSDEEIKDCYYFNSKDNAVRKNNNLNHPYHHKIILTTDQDLIKDGVQAIDDEFLEWFVKNPSCEEVETSIEETQYSNGIYEYVIYKRFISKEEPKQETLEEAAERAHNCGLFSTKTAFIAGVKWQQEQHRIDTDDAYNEGFENGKHFKQERMYSEEDMREAFRQGHRSSIQLGSYNEVTQQEDYIKWFEQFKKK